MANAPPTCCHVSSIKATPFSCPPHLHPSGLLCAGPASAATAVDQVGSHDMFFCPAVATAQRHPHLGFSAAPLRSIEHDNPPPESFPVDATWHEPVTVRASHFIHLRPLSWSSLVAFLRSTSGVVGGVLGSGYPLPQNLVVWSLPAGHAHFSRRSFETRGVFDLRYAAGAGPKDSLGSRFPTLT